MSKKVSPSLNRFRDPSLYQSLHIAIKGLTSFDGNLKSDRERSRTLAFATERSGGLFAYQYLLASVSGKFQEGQVSAASRKATAISQFLEAEDVCRETNSRLYDAFNRPSAQRFWGRLARARRIIAEILGPCSPDLIVRQCGFSSGASTEANRSRSMVQLKWDEGSHVTKEALPYVLAYHKHVGSGYLDRSFTVVDGNVVFTVPKNFERDRTCAMEPSWNMFFQKGVGRFIRQRLRSSVGLLLPDAQLIHMRLAQDASVTNSVATLDLKAASDSIALALVDLLVPDDLKAHLYRLRSKRGKLPDGTVITYEKISSMGNGFTFELETLLFYALCKACCSQDELVSVYGDDLVVPGHRVSSVVSLLKFCGFTTNLEKSFATGPFRESCGGHYYRGVDVKPFYIQRFPTTLSQTIQLHNDVIAWIGRTGLKLTALTNILRECRRIVPRKFWGPLGTDGCLWSEWDEATPKFVKGSRRINHPAYQHWRVSTVRKAVCRQTHDYLFGGLLMALARSTEQPVPPYVARNLSLRDLASSWDCNVPLASEISFEGAGEEFGWVAVGVGRQWPCLPVRLA